MIFKKMTLNNFRQFKGETNINFSTDEKKNVTMILGDNGAGKTTLLQAFNWCLYDTVKLENPDELLNKDVITSMGIGDTAKVEVKLEFEHLKNVYTCRNYLMYIRNTDGSIKKLDAGHTFTITDFETGETKKRDQSAIREIFPKDLSVYFLFDGERMQDLVDNQRTGKKDLSNAVKNLLGLDVLENGKYHLEKVKKEFESEFISDSSSRLAEINEELKRLDVLIDTETKNREIYETEIAQLEKEQSNVNNILKSYAGLKELQIKRNEYDKELQRLNTEIEDSKNIIFRTFGDVAAIFFLGKSLKVLQSKIRKSDLKDKGIEGINGTAIENLLKRGTCVCGCDLASNPQAVAKLHELKKYLPPESYSVLLKGLEVNINNKLENNERYYDNFNNMYDKYNNLINKKDQLINKINENEKLIADIGDKDLSEYNRKYIDLKEKIAIKNQAIGSCKQAIETAKEKVRIREDERSRLTTTNNVNNMVQFKVDICSKLISDFANRLTKREKEVKEELQDKTSELLTSMLNSNKEIVIENDYNFSVYDEYKTTTLSEGEKIVTSFAFVGAIIAVAKKVIESEYDSKFPLVMDAPFAKLDLKHRENVTQFIPNLTDQIILFSADSQWDAVVQKSLNDKIGTMYELQKEKSGISSLKPVVKEAN